MDTKSTKDTVDIRFTVSKELHKVLRVLAVQEDTTMQKLLPVLISAGMAHHAQVAQKAQAAQKAGKVRGVRKDTKRTGGKGGTVGTDMTVVPLDS